MVTESSKSEAVGSLDAGKRPNQSAAPQDTEMAGSVVDAS